MEEIYVKRLEDLKIFFDIMRNSAHQPDTRSYRDAYLLCVAAECLLELLDSGQCEDMKNVLEGSYKDMGYILNTWKIHQPPRYHLKYSRIKYWIQLMLIFYYINEYISTLGDLIEISQETKNDIFTIIGEHIADDVTQIVPRSHPCSIMHIIKDLVFTSFSKLSRICMVLIQHFLQYVEHQWN